MWSRSPTIRKCGCGIVAAYDTALYLKQKDTADSFQIPDIESYCLQLEKLQHNFFPILYPAGINGIMLAAGLNKLFRKMSLPYSAAWSASGEKLSFSIIQMLEHDIPVILAAGPNLNLLRHKEGLRLYRRNPNDKNTVYRNVSGHYMVVTGISEDWMTVSSWGKCFYISLPEYTDYVRSYSTYLFSNIIQIRPN